MTKSEARKRIIDYLKMYNIPYHLLNNSGKPLAVDDLTLYIRFYVEKAPDHLAECSIWFYEKSFEVRAYFSENAAGWVNKHKGRIPDVLRVINFMNARVFFGSLFTPRLYLTADEKPEFAITTVIPYLFFETAELETLEYITCFYPEFLDKASFPLFLTLLGKITPEMAFYHIKTKLLNEKDACVEWNGDD